MKIKFLAIYILAGVAFVGVSLWLFLSGGKSAKATSAKYKLGGIMLTAWSLLSAASCDGILPTVTCYEPMPPDEQVTCYDVALESEFFTVTVKDYGGNNLKPGDTMVFTLDYRTAGQYKFLIHAGDVQAPVIQEFTKSFENTTDHVEFEQVLVPTDYRGEAVIEAIALYLTEDPDNAEERQVASVIINIVG